MKNFTKEEIEILIKAVLTAQVRVEDAPKLLKLVDKLKKVKDEKTNNERLAVLENEVKNLKTDNKEEHLEIKLGLKKIDIKLNKFIDSADKRYSPMWVADTVKFLIGLILTAFIATVAYFIGWK